MLQVADCFCDSNEYYVGLGDTTVQLLGSGRGALPLQEGWAPVALLLGVPGVAVLRLRHRSGGTAIWYFGPDFCFMTHLHDELIPAMRAALREKLPSFPEIDWERYPKISVDRAIVRPQSTPVAILPQSVVNERSHSEFDELARFWRENDYVVVKNALTPEAIAVLTASVTFEDRDSVDDPRQFYRIHNDRSCAKLIAELHVAIHGFYERLFGIALQRTAAFAMRYIQNSDLLPHYDNIYTAISSTICYHSSPDGAQSPLYLDRAKFLNPHQQRLTVKDRAGIPLVNVAKLDLQPGDLAAFRGRTHLHWREAVEGEMDYRAVLAHFTDAEYNGTLLAPKFVQGVPRDLVDIDSYQEFRELYSSYFERSGQGWV